MEEPSYTRIAHRLRTPSLINPKDIQSYWRKWREQRGEPS